MLWSASTTRAVAALVAFVFVGCAPHQAVDRGAAPAAATAFVPQPGRAPSETAARDGSRLARTGDRTAQKPRPLSAFADAVALYARDVDGFARAPFEQRKEADVRRLVREFADALVRAGGGADTSRAWERMHAEVARVEPEPNEPEGWSWIARAMRIGTDALADLANGTYADNEQLRRRIGELDTAVDALTPDQSPTQAMESITLALSFGARALEALGEAGAR